jgi:hypothetical protein
MKNQEAIQCVLAAFDRVNLVALGERHRTQEDSQFRLALVQTPSFPRKVNDIVIEFANPIYQSLLDRFINGEPTPVEEVRHIWRDTTQLRVWNCPVYEEFLYRVREVNAQLNPGERIRVLAGDSPIDWRAISTPADLDGPMMGRNQSAANIIQSEVLDKKRKALVIFGSRHFDKNQPKSIFGRLKEDPRATWFIINSFGGPGLPAVTAANVATAKKPALLRLDREPAMAQISALELVGEGTYREKMVDGKRVLQDGKPVLIPAFDSDLKIGEVTDAFLYFGAEDPEIIPVPAEI